MNTHVGYHYHAVTDCLPEAPATFGALKGTTAAEHGTQIRIAMDGLLIFSNPMASGAAPENLYSCNGHGTDNIAYHYHAGAAGSNAILGCLVAEAGCALEDEMQPAIHRQEHRARDKSTGVDGIDRPSRMERQRT